MNAKSAFRIWQDLSVVNLQSVVTFPGLIEELIECGHRLLSRVVDSAFGDAKFLGNVFDAIVVEDHLENPTSSARKLAQQPIDQIFQFGRIGIAAAVCQKIVLAKRHIPA